MVFAGNLGASTGLPHTAFEGQSQQLLEEEEMLMGQVQGKEKCQGLLLKDLLFCQFCFTGRHFATPLGGCPGV